MTEAEKIAKLLWSASTAKVPTTYVAWEPGKYRATPVMVGPDYRSQAPEGYDGPVALSFAPREKIAYFSRYFYFGIELSMGFEEDPPYSSRWREGYPAFALDGEYYRVDFAADHMGAIPVNLEILTEDEIMGLGPSRTDLMALPKSLPTARVLKTYAEDCEAEYAIFMADSVYKPIDHRVSVQDLDHLCKLDGFVQVKFMFDAGRPFTSTKYLMSDLVLNNYSTWYETFRPFDVPLSQAMPANTP